MSKAYDIGKSITGGIRKLRFLPGGDDYEALVDFPYLCFEEYEQSNDSILRGQVRRVGSEKWCAQNDMKLDRAPDATQGWKLFRDSGRYPWVREEFCLKGFEREYNGEWYIVKSDRVDSATPPPNDEQNWEKV